MRRGTTLDALVWRRHDFRESSRIVTLLTREQGKVRAFAKGGHRPDSVLLGKVDFLNHLRVELWRRGDTMPLLSRADLLHEPRGLREPARYLVADYLAELVDLALPDERADDGLCDLAHGTVTLCERCPLPALATVLCGLEWRFLLALGMQPEIDACADTGAPLPARARVVLAPSGRGFVPALSAPPGHHLVGDATRDVLRTLGAAPAKTWATLHLPQPAVGAALGLLGQMVPQAIEKRPSGRTKAVQVALRAMAGAPKVTLRDRSRSRD